MKNKKLIGIVVGVIVLLVSIICIVIGINNSKELPNKSNNNIENDDEEVLVREDGLNLTMTEENLEEIKETMNSVQDQRVPIFLYRQNNSFLYHQQITEITVHIGALFISKCMNKPAKVAVNRSFSFASCQKFQSVPAQ